MKLFRIIVTALTLCISITAMSFGVVAATQTDYELGAYVKFEVDDCNITVEVEHNSGAVTQAGAAIPKNFDLFSPITYTQEATINITKIYFDDFNIPYTSTIPNVVVDFKFTNNSEYTATLDCAPGEAFSQGHGYYNKMGCAFSETATEIEPFATKTITITFSLLDITTPITEDTTTDTILSFAFAPKQ